MMMFIVRPLHSNTSEVTKKAVENILSTTFLFMIQKQNHIIPKMQARRKNRKIAMC